MVVQPEVRNPWERTRIHQGIPISHSLKKQKTKKITFLFYFFDFSHALF
jgi:hypothetical protein